MDQDNITPFPGSGTRAVDIDALLAKVDGADNPGQLYLMVVRALADGRDDVKPDATAENARRFMGALTLAYLAAGTLLGAKRDLMVKAIR